MYIIYKSTNILTNKCYIGYTHNLPRRILTHKSASKNGKSKFYNAIRKYGWSNFKWEILFESDNMNECLNIKEPYYIKLFDSINNGYNTTPGGECNPLFKSDNGMYGKTHTEEVKKRLSILARKRFKGKSYIELYGEEKANQLKHIRSLIKKDNSASKNPRFDSKIYIFFNNTLNIIHMSTRYYFMVNYNMNRTTVHEIVNHKTRKGWRIL